MATVSRFTRQEKQLLALMAAINFTHIVDFVIMMPLGPQLQRSFKLDPHQFGMLVSSYSFAAAATGLLCSFIVDRFDRKSLLLFFFVGFAGGTIACALSRNYAWLLLSRSLTGMFGGVLGSVVLAVVSDAIAVERRGTAMGIVMGSFSVASVLGVPFSLILATQFDWHAPFMALGLLAAAIAGMVAWTMPPMRGHLRGEIDGPPVDERHDPLRTLKQIAINPNQLMALSFIFCLVFGQSSIIPFLSQSFVFNGGLKESQLPLIYLTGGMVSMIASPAFGRLSDRFGKKPIFYVGALASIVPMFLITHVGNIGVPLLLILSCSFFLVMSGRMVPSMALMSTTTTSRFRGGFMSISSCVQHLALSLASYVSGLIVAQDKSGHLLRFEWPGWIGIIFTLVAVALVRKVKSVET